MDNYLKYNLLNILEEERKNLTEEICTNITNVFKGYEKICSLKNLNIEKVKDNLRLYINLIKQELKNPTEFGIFHERQTSPIDFYSFGVEFLTPFINKEESHICGKKNIEKILSYLNAGENVILLANHQAEADPGILAVLLEDKYPGLIQNMISVAGARVTTDPMTVPLTLGQNVLCVYSKKYFMIHEDKKKSMQQHNSTAMLTLRHLLNKGGKCIFVAPSGGRDRKTKDGNLTPAKFDQESIELMRLVGSKSNNNTHYFPLALYTYPILPPPEKIKKEIGEERKMCHSPVHINFGEEIKMLEPSLEEKKDKDAFRKKQADAIHSIVTKLYETITS